MTPMFAISDQIWAQIIGTVILVSGQIVAAWKANEAAKLAAQSEKGQKETRKILDARTVKFKNISDELAAVHESVNGGVAAAKDEIVALKAEVATLKQSLAREKN